MKKMHILLMSFAIISLLLVGCEKSTNPVEVSFSDQSGVSSLTKHTSPLTGAATLAPRNQLGVSGQITFTDDGTTLTVAGTATGMTPGVLYVSLIYDNGSVPGGPTACEPTDASLTDPQMFVGVWLPPFGGSARTLAAAKAGASYAGLNAFKTMSIRNTSINGGFGPLAVAACGAEATHGQR